MPIGRTALIVSHGQPSDPGPAAVELAALAAKVAACLPGWDLRSVTLAEPGALARRVAAQGPQGLVYPLFMAAGWFSTVQLPRLLAEAEAGAGGAGWRVLAPFGTDPAIQSLCLTQAREAAARLGQVPSDTEVLLAAHGSFASPAPSDLANVMAARLRAEVGFGRAEAYFIDQSPQISAARGFGPGAICLPFFVANLGHVQEDLPGALSAAGFSGTVLDPLGLDPRVPALIAAALTRGQGG